MNLLIINKYLIDKSDSKNFIVYYTKKNDDFGELKKIINDSKPEKIISLDFALQTTSHINNGSIVVAKETISYNSKPINWSIPREDRWMETYEELNKSICDILEKHTFEHYIGSGIELENSQNIHKRLKAKKWINENLSGTYIDNYSSKLNQFIQNNSLKISLVRIIHSSFPINQKQSQNSGNWNVIKRFFKELYFYNITSRKIKNEIIQKKLILEFSKIK